MIEVFIDILTVISIILPVLFFIGFVRNDKAYKCFTLYLTFIAIIQIVAFIYVSEKIDNTFLFHYYFIGQFLFLSIFYYLLLKKWWVYMLSSILFVGLLLYYFVNPSIINEYHTYGVTTTQTVVIVYALAYYYKSLSGKAYMLLINTGILIYLMVSVLFFASNNLLIELEVPNETQKYIGLFNEISYLIFMILIFIEWYRNYLKKSKKIKTYPH